MKAIFTYHSIDRSGSPVSIAPEVFRGHLDWLASRNTPVVPLTELMALPDDAEAIALTFDDALASVAAEAAPMLVDYGFPATVFVVSGHVGGDNRWEGVADPAIPVQPILSWDALGKLQAQGFTVGAHGRRHRRLTECSAGEVEDEIGGSARDIEDALGQAPRTFAYPYGAVNPAVARVAAAEFQIACTTRFQLVHQGARRELMPRLDSLYFRDASRLTHWGTRSFTRFVAVRRILRSMRRLAGWRGQRLSYASDIHDSFTCSEGPAG